MHLYCIVKIYSEFHVATWHLSNRLNASLGDTLPWGRAADSTCWVMAAQHRVSGGFSEMGGPQQWAWAFPSTQRNHLQCRRHRRLRFSPRVAKIPCSGKWQPTPGSLPGEFHGQRSWAGCSPRGHREPDTTAAEHTHAAASLPGDTPSCPGPRWRKGQWERALRQPARFRRGRAHPGCLHERIRNGEELSVLSVLLDISQSWRRTWVCVYICEARN